MHAHAPPPIQAATRSTAQRLARYFGSKRLTADRRHVILASKYIEITKGPIAASALLRHANRGRTGHDPLILRRELHLATTIARRTSYALLTETGALESARNPWPRVRALCRMSARLEPHARWTLNRNWRTAWFQEIDEHIVKGDTEEVSRKVFGYLNDLSHVRYISDIDEFSRKLTKENVSSRADFHLPVPLSKGAANRVKRHPSLEYVNLSVLLWRYGFFRWSLNARSAAHAAAENPGGGTGAPPVLEQYAKMLSALDEGNSSSALRLLDTTSAAVEKSISSRDGGIYKNAIERLENNLRPYAMLMAHGLDSFQSYVESLEEFDDNFSRAIQEKAVAVVGNASSPMDAIFEEGFDIIVTLNTAVNENLSNGNEITRVISWAVTPGEEEAKRLGNEKRQYRADWIMSTRGLCGKLEGVSSAKEHIKGVLPELLSGSLNHGMAVVYELLKYKPERLKIFNMNFYLDKKVYADGYSRFSMDDRETSLFTILAQANHDNLSQIHFVRNLVKHGNVEVDEGCQAVLDLSDEEYVNQVCEIVRELDTSCTAK